MICKICDIETEPYGRKEVCYRCYMKDFNKKYYIKHLDKIKKQTKEYYHKNKNKKVYQEMRRKYQYDNKGYLSEKKHEYFQKNRDKIMPLNKEYYNKNKKDINKQQYNRKKQRLQNDINFRLKETLSTRMRMAILNHKGIKHSPAIILLGAPIEIVRKHLEDQFKDGMTWDNHGQTGWHIDHIVPCKDFDLTSEEEQLRCFHYTNLQPLWMIDNIRKDHCAHN